jgi:hypothetical protein
MKNSQVTQVTRLHECTHTHAGKSSLDALEAGVNAVELDTQEQYYVGLGGVPNAKVSMGGIILYLQPLLICKPLGNANMLQHCNA